jgi:hypothetical protein
MVAIEAFVFLLSVEDRGGDSGFLLELFRDSHEKGLVSFLVVGGGKEICFSTAEGAGGGGGNLTGDILPESPCRPVMEDARGGSFGRIEEAFAAPSAGC